LRPFFLLAAFLAFRAAFLTFLLAFRAPFLAAFRAFLTALLAFFAPFFRFFAALRLRTAFFTASTALSTDPAKGDDGGVEKGGAPGPGAAPAATWRP